MKVIRLEHDGCIFYIPANEDIEIASIQWSVECPLCGQQVTGDFPVVELQIPDDFNWLAWG